MASSSMELNSNWHDVITVSLTSSGTGYTEITLPTSIDNLKSLSITPLGGVYNTVDYSSDLAFLFQSYSDHTTGVVRVTKGQANKKQDFLVSVIY